VFNAEIFLSFILAYLSDQFSFVRGLNQSSRKELLVRLYWKDYDWAQEQRFKEQFPDLLFSTCDTPAHQVIRSSRLFVATYNATTYLETFTADFPTIIFWDPSQWKMFPSAQGYFDRLRSAGILFDTPEAAARKVNEIFDDPMAWWRSRDVQQAKNEFCARFARTSDNWLEEWRKELRMCAQGVKVGK
jgi:putative transferase (TIGR04331 family)